MPSDRPKVTCNQKRQNGAGLKAQEVEEQINFKHPVTREEPLQTIPIDTVTGKLAEQRLPP